MTSAKKFGAALSAGADWREAVQEAVFQAARGLEGASCDLLILFVADLFTGLNPAELAAAAQKALPSRDIVAVNASGVLGGSREIEFAPAVSAFALSAPDAKIKTFHFSPRELASLESPAALIEALDVYPTEKPRFLLFADPASFDVETSLGLFNAAYPGAPAVGGLASGYAIGKPSWLLLGSDVLTEGLVGCVLTGAIDFNIAVAQGCRPIGKPWLVTKASENLVYQLGGRPALETLKETLEEISPREQALARRALFAGILMDEKRRDFKAGDFLVRHILGFDPPNGAMALGAEPRPGQTIQFLVRDAKTSADDLREWLDGLALKPGVRYGALLSSCCGRGRGLYGKPDHDSALIQKTLGPIPLAGFFANGEIGPVLGRNYVHGYTSSLVVIS